MCFCVSRCEYDSTCCLLVSLFDQTASAYQKLLQGSLSSPQLPLREGGHLLVRMVMLNHVSCVGQMTWLIYLIGSIIGGRMNQYSATDYGSVDGQLICRCVCVYISGCGVGLLLFITRLHHSSQQSITTHGLNRFSLATS